MSFDKIKNFVEQHQGFYTDFPNTGSVYSVVDGKIKTDAKVLNKLADYSVVVINLARDPWLRGQTDFVYDLLQQAGIKNFFVLTHNPKDHLCYPNVFYFPYYYHLMLDVIDPVDCTNLLKKYKMSCFLGASYNHRIKLWIELCSKPYVDNSLITICNAPDVGRTNDFELDNHCILAWDQIKNSLPSHQERMKTNNSRWFNIDYPEYQDSYVNLITETIILPELFFSEKTWKPIATGQLFLTFAPPTSMAYLKNIGVDTFDDIIDHDYYDSEPNPNTRLSKVLDVLDTLMTSNLEQIYQDTTQRRQLNQHKYFNNQFDSQYLSLILNSIEKSIF
jgi:hypothetical protein